MSKRFKIDYRRNFFRQSGQKTGRPLEHIVKLGRNSETEINVKEILLSQKFTSAAHPKATR